MGDVAKLREEAWKATCDEVVRLYKEGLSLRKIGEKVGASHETVRQIAKAAGLPMRGHGHTLAQKKEAVRLYVEHPKTPVRVIAEKFGVDARTVQSWARKSGAPKRRK